MAELDKSIEGAKSNVMQNKGYIRTKEGSWPTLALRKLLPCMAVYGCGIDRTSRVDSVIINST